VEQQVSLPLFLIETETETQATFTSHQTRLPKPHGLGAKAKLWASLRNLFNVLVFNSMEALYKHMASLYRLQIE
jgi:hypothetical protein